MDNGYEARINGLSIDENPNPTDTIEFFDWEAGYKEAKNVL